MPKRFEPTADQRKLVRDLASIGCTVDEIRQCIPWNLAGGRVIDEKTLRKHFRAELDRGYALDAMRVKKRLHDLIDQGNVAAIIFYLKVRCGYSEVVKVEATGKDGVPLQAAQTIVYLPSKDPRVEGTPLAIDITASASPGAIDHAPSLKVPAHESVPTQPPRRALPEAPTEPRAVGAVGSRGVIYPVTADMRR